MASRRTHRFSLNQVLEYILQGGSDNEGESIEKEIEQEDEEFLFDEMCVCELLCVCVCVFSAAVCEKVFIATE